MRPDAQMTIAAVLQTAVPIEGPEARLTLELMSVRHCSDNYRRHWCRCRDWPSFHRDCHLRNREVHEEHSLETYLRDCVSISTLVVGQGVRTLVGKLHVAIEADSCRIPWRRDKVALVGYSMVNTFVWSESMSSWYAGYD